MRTIIIGDIHGCFRELKELLKKTEYGEKDRLISLGDLMDRGEQSYEVFDFFRKLKMQQGEQCVIIRGNHEQMMLDAEADVETEELWHFNGGKKTVKSFRDHQDNIASHRGWFRKNTVLYYEDEQFQCTHAGVWREPISANPPEILLWDRSCLDVNQYRGKLTIVGHTPFKEALYFRGDGKEESALEEGQVQDLPEGGIICIDTGCVFKRKLTAMVIEGERFYLTSAQWKRRA